MYHGICIDLRRMSRCALISRKVITDRLICVYNGVLKIYNLCVNVHVDVLLVNVSL